MNFGSSSCSGAPSLFLQLQLMPFLSGLSTTPQTAAEKGRWVAHGEAAGLTGGQETSLALLVMGEQLAGARRWGRGWTRGSGACRGGSTPLLQLPARVLAPCKRLQPVIPRSLLPEQLAVGLFRSGWLLARKWRWKSLLQMCTAARRLRPLHRSAGLAVCQAARGGGGSCRGDGVHICQATVSPHHMWRGHRDGSQSRLAVPAKAGASPARPPGGLPCLVLAKSSEWDFQYFLWQRSLQPSYLPKLRFP